MFDQVFNNKQALEAIKDFQQEDQPPCGVGQLHLFKN